MINHKINSILSFWQELLKNYLCMLISQIIRLKQKVGGKPPISISSASCSKMEIETGS